MGAPVAMMAAMMIPGAIPAMRKIERASASAFTVPLFVGSYLVVWAIAGVILLNAASHPHSDIVAAAAVIAAGAYELTPLKRFFRRRCRETVRSGFEFGLCCLGSCIGLMLLLVAIDAMSVAWMAAIATIVVVQKLLPARAALDVPLALAMMGIGILIIVAPSAVPGFMPGM